MIRRGEPGAPIPSGRVGPRECWGQRETLCGWESQNPRVAAFLAEGSRAIRAQLPISKASSPFGTHSPWPWCANVHPRRGRADGEHGELQLARNIRTVDSGHARSQGLRIAHRGLHPPRRPLSPSRRRYRGRRRGNRNR